MQLSEGVEWAVHCATVLAALPPGAALPAARLAEFHGVPPAYLAKHLQALSAAGVAESVRGPRGGYRLARPAEQVSVLDVVLAVEGDRPAFSCSEIRRRGPSAGPDGWYPHVCTIARTMWDAEAEWRRVLAARTIADLLGDIACAAEPAAVAATVAWIDEVRR